MTFSPYLIAILIAWLVAQGSKYIVASLRAGNLKQLRQLYLSGNMPSAHSASVVSLLVLIGLLDGVNSAIFALAALFAAIVIYDAVMVRRSSGEQGLALVKLIKVQNKNTKLPFVAKGHTVAEVLVGAVIGALVAVVVFFTTK